MSTARVIIVWLVSVMLAAHARAAAETPPYLDPDQPLDSRVLDLIGRMTPAEKIAQLSCTAPALDRLSIPAYDYWNESLHGVARAGRATVFPQAIGLAATFDTDLMSRVASAISDEARAKLGFFDPEWRNPYSRIPASVIGCAEHRGLARAPRRCRSRFGLSGRPLGLASTQTAEGRRQGS